MKNKLATKLYPTEIRTISFQQLRGFIADLRGDAGYEAHARDLFHLVVASTNTGMYEKLLIQVTGDSPVEWISVTKLGKCYTLMMSKSNRVEYISSKCVTLINMVQGYDPAPMVDAAPSKDIETLKGKNLASLIKAIEKAEAAKGQRAEIKDVFRHLMPQARLGLGKVVHRTPSYSVIFNGFLGCMIAEIVDSDGFKITTTSCRELRRVLGSKA